MLRVQQVIGDQDLRVEAWAVFERVASWRWTRVSIYFFKRSDAEQHMHGLRVAARNGQGK